MSSDQKWLLVIMRPWEPEVDEFATEAEARAAYERALVVEHEADGQYEVVVYVARVDSSHTIRTHY